MRWAKSRRSFIFILGVDLVEAYKAMAEMGIGMAMEMEMEMKMVMEMGMEMEAEMKMAMEMEMEMAIPSAITRFGAQRSSHLSLIRLNTLSTMS